MQNIFRFRIISFLASICILLCCSCAQKNNGYAELSTKASIQFTESKTTNSISAELLEFNIDVPNGWDLGCITAADRFIYYELCHVDPVTSNYSEVNIYQLDTRFKTSKLMKQIIGSTTFWTNELIAVGDSLFWVYRDGREMRIDELSINNNTSSTLQTCPVEYPDLILSGNNQYLTWFVLENNVVRLYAYDSKSKETFLVSDSISNDSAYTRAYVCENITAFVKKNGDAQFLIVYDLAQKRETASYVIPNGFEMTRLQANASYIICTDGYTKSSSIFLSDGTNDELRKVDLSDHEINLFSCHLIGDRVIINSNQYKEIVILSLKDNRFMVIPTNHSLFQGCISASGDYIACDTSDTIVLLRGIS